MQTFLPLSSFSESAKVLDYRRLGKQRVEAMQIVNMLVAISDGENVKGWRNHPAVKMWTHHVDALKHYHNVMIEEWVRRGYKNTMRLYDVSDDVVKPAFIGDEGFHASHRAALLFKDFSHYSTMGWSETPELNYLWPL